MRVSLFLPTVSVYDSGRITVDFGDSYDNTTDTESGKTTCDGAEGPHPELLDKVLGEGTVAERLRRLADYVEGRGDGDPRG